MENGLLLLQLTLSFNPDYPSHNKKNLLIEGPFALFLYKALVRMLSPSLCRRHASGRLI